MRIIILLFMLSGSMAARFSVDVKNIYKEMLPDLQKIKNDSLGPYRFFTNAKTWCDCSGEAMRDLKNLLHSNNTLTPNKLESIKRLKINMDALLPHLKGKNCLATTATRKRRQNRTMKYYVEFITYLNSRC